MIAFLKTRLGRLVASLLAALTILVGVFQYGRKTKAEEFRVDQLEAYKETKETIDAVKPAADSDAAFERLRDNGWLR